MSFGDMPRTKPHLVISSEETSTSLNHGGSDKNMHMVFVIYVTTRIQHDKSDPNRRGYSRANAKKDISNRNEAANEHI